MAEEIEIHPMLAAAPLSATEQLAIESAGCGEVVYGNREVERR